MEVGRASTENMGVIFRQLAYLVLTVSMTPGGARDFHQSCGPIYEDKVRKGGWG